MREKIKDSHIFKPITYRTGINEGYKDYLDIDNRLDYWEKYLELLWDVVYPELKVEYFGNWKKFHDDSINCLRALSDKAMRERSLLLGEKVRLFSSANKENNQLNIEDFVLLTPDNTDDGVVNERKRCSIM